jgi:Arylsulfotransferase (ASST)
LSGPRGALQRAYTEVKDFTEHWKNDLGIEPTRYLVAARKPTGGEAAARPSLAARGLRIVAGYFHARAAAMGAILFDEQGRERHFWPIDYQRIAAGVGHDFPHARHNFLHGFEVLPDGSIVASFDSGGVLARLDACGRVTWALPGGYHRAVGLEGDGDLWAVGGPGSGLYANAISKIDPDEGTLSEMIRFDDGLLARMGKGVFFIRRVEEGPEPGWLPDPLHLNDVDRLDESMAEAFPLFEAGDIMLSMRNSNLIVIVDAKDLHIKWWQHGPWHRQHDPDFMPNGRISVFSNNMNGDASRIIEIDPVTRETEVVLEGSPQLPFYTWRRGNHQRLDNGSILITETEAGRVFEVDGDGRLVWEYENRFDEDRNLVVSNSIWAPRDFFEPGALRCLDGTGDAAVSDLEGQKRHAERGREP